VSTRQIYTMTQAQYDKLLEAMKPVPLIMLQVGMPTSQQENANRAWAALGDEMGFEPMSVRPHGRDERQFTAIPKADYVPIGGAV